MFICFKDLPRAKLIRAIDTDIPDSVTTLPYYHQSSPESIERIKMLVDPENKDVFLPAFVACPLTTTSKNLREELMRSNVVITRKPGEVLPNSISFMRSWNIGQSKVRVEISLYCDTEDDVISHVIKHLRHIINTTSITSVISLICYWPLERFNDDRLWGRVVGAIGQEPMSYEDRDINMCRTYVMDFPKMVASKL